MNRLPANTTWLIAMGVLTRMHLAILPWREPSLRQQPIATRIKAARLIAAEARRRRRQRSRERG